MITVKELKYVHLCDSPVDQSLGRDSVAVRGILGGPRHYHTEDGIFQLISQHRRKPCTFAVLLGGRQSPIKYHPVTDGTPPPPPPPHYTTSTAADVLLSFNY